MKNFSIVILLMGLLFAAPSQAFAAFNIFACEPEWGSLAKEIGGDKVKVKNATSAFQNPHNIRARPGLIAAMRKSDLVFCSGGGLEIAWLPILLQKSGSADVQYGNVGYFMASDFVKRLEIPEKIDRAMGDVHPEGNPHIHTNPHNISKVAKELANRLQKLDAGNADYYRQNFDSFMTRWNGAIKRWEKMAEPLKGVPIIVQHGSWAYLVDWLGLRRIGTLEPKPGVPPTVSHLESVLNKVRTYAFFTH